MPGAPSPGLLFNRLLSEFADCWLFRAEPLWLFCSAPVTARKE